MPKYDVVITRTLTLSTMITVEARNEGLAEAKALTQGSAPVLEWRVKDKLEWYEDDDDCRVISLEPNEA